MAAWDYTLKVNGTDSESMGFYVAEFRGNWDTPTFSRDEVQVPRHDGPIRTVVEPELDGKDGVIVGTLYFTSESGFEAGVDEFKHQLASSTLAVAFGNQPTRSRSCTLRDFKATFTDGQGAIDEAHVEITLHFSDPIATETTPTTAITGGAAATDHPCALGTWVSWPVITHTSPTSPLTETYKNYGGTTIGDPLVLSFPGSPTTVVVDHSAQTITVDGVRHDEYLTAGDFFPLSPYDGTRSTSHWPTVRTSSGTVTIVYSQRWL